MTWGDPTALLDLGAWGLGTWGELLLFVPLAVLLNTGVPVAFDPVLVAFAAGHDAGTACLYAVAASAGAGLAGFVDLGVFGAVRRRKLPDWARRFPAPAGARFYAWTALVALSPLPFSIVRAALLRERPSPLLYTLSIAAGRLPRYVVTVLVWESLALPVWASAALFGALALVLLVPPITRRLFAHA